MSVLIKDIQKSGNEIIRIEISEFKGRELINIRIWFQAFDDRGNAFTNPPRRG